MAQSGVLTLCKTHTNSTSSPSHCTSRLLMAPQVILCVDLPGHKLLQPPPPTPALCSTSSYPRPHQWTILALSAESCHSRASGRLPKPKTAGRGRGWRGVGGLGGRPSSERRRRERKQGREGDGERERKCVCITLGNIGRSSIGNKLFSLGCLLLDIFIKDQH